MSKYDSGPAHVVIPVYSPGDDAVHNVAVPESIDLSDVHKSLQDSGYAPMPSDSKEPTTDGSVEHDSRFKQAAMQAWVRCGLGKAQKESGFIVGRNGNTVPLPASTGPTLQIPELPGSASNLHTHPDDRNDEPSPADIEDAKKTKRTLFITSRTGLWSIDPAGQVTHVYQSPQWFKDKEPK